MHRVSQHMVDRIVKRTRVCAMNHPMRIDLDAMVLLKQFSIIATCVVDHIVSSIKAFVGMHYQLVSVRTFEHVAQVLVPGLQDGGNRVKKQ